MYWVGAIHGGGIYLIAPATLLRQRGLFFI